MARYDYFCDDNQQLVEVSHSMKDAALATWGEVCERSGRSLGETPASAPVRRLISGGSGFILKGKGDEGPAAWNESAGGGHSCGSMCGCAGGGSFGDN